MTALDRTAAPPQDEATRRPRRRTGWAVAALAVAVIGGGALYALVAPGRTTPATTDGPKEDTATVTRQTLVNSQQVDGTLGYAGSTTVNAQLPGIVTGLPGLGRTITRGHPLYSVDETPVVLMYGSAPAYRELKPGEEGQDVRQLETNLRALGYDGFTADDTYTAATASAVERWQKDLGLPTGERTGKVPLGRIVFASGALRISAHRTQAGSDAAPGTPVLAATSDKRQVHVDLDVANQSLARKNEKVTVSLPGGRTVQGTITSVGTVVTVTPGTDGGSDKSTIGVDIAVNSRDAGAYTQAPVTVGLRTAEKKNVLTVPVTALLALSEGGYGVEVVGTGTGTGTGSGSGSGSGGRSTIIPVTLGMFADGRVEVSGRGLAAGTEIGVAQ
ncbi:peptidoglycan-binding protein [Streptomyces sp. NBC_01288]|uniref:peptidoglycan-binding domain-containing protein n=1 Tax=Streptomyces sp. NBC_01288 TaxID=2903814 RepID=UPI002E147B73|nr:peptidoglycan-binding protein [Streptomyces sp. NBC_01288]